MLLKNIIKEDDIKSIGNWMININFHLKTDDINYPEIYSNDVFKIRLNCHADGYIQYISEFSQNLQRFCCRLWKMYKK